MTIIKDFILQVLSQNYIKHSAVAHMLNQETESKEFKTISLSLPRHCGKSTTILEMYRPGDLIVIRDLNRIKQYNKSVSIITIKDLEDKCEFFNMYKEEERIKKYNFIFFDECKIPDIIYKINLAKVYISLRTD